MTVNFNTAPSGGFHPGCEVPAWHVLLSSTPSSSHQIIFPWNEGRFQNYFKEIFTQEWCEKLQTPLPLRSLSHVPQASSGCQKMPLSSLCTPRLRGAWAHNREVSWGHRPQEQCLPGCLTLLPALGDSHVTWSKRSHPSPGEGDQSDLALH